MLNLRYENGLIVPARESLGECSLQEAVGRLREISMISIMESVTDNKQGIVKRFINYIKELIERVIMFFKRWIRRLRGYKNEKTKEIMENKKAILNFSKRGEIILVPEKMLEAKMINCDTVYKEVNKLIDSNEKIARSDEFKQGTHPNLSKSAHDLYDEILTAALDGFNGHNRNMKIIESHLYGDEVPVDIMDLDRTKLLDQFTRLDGELDEIGKFKDVINIHLTTLTTDLQRHADGIKTIGPKEQLTVNYLLKFYTAVMHVLDMIFLIFSRRYNRMYLVLKTMAKEDKPKQTNGANP